MRQSFDGKMLEWLYPCLGLAAALHASGVQSQLSNAGLYVYPNSAATIVNSKEVVSVAALDNMSFSARTDYGGFSAKVVEWHEGSITKIRAELSTYYDEIGVYDPPSDQTFLFSGIRVNEGVRGLLKAVSPDQKSFNFDPASLS